MFNECFVTPKLVTSTKLELTILVIKQMQIYLQRVQDEHMVVKIVVDIKTTFIDRNQTKYQ